VRHNEDKLNMAFSQQVRWPVDPAVCGDPHAKANLLFQGHFSRLALPIADYVTDTRSVLDNSLRLVQAMIDVAADQGWLSNTLETIHLNQVQCNLSLTANCLSKNDV
jgi:activating signal cointegrator complex subunit 3